VAGKEQSGREGKGGGRAGEQVKRGAGDTAEEDKQGNWGKEEELMSGVLYIMCAGWTPVLGQMERAKELFRWPEKGSGLGTTALLVVAIVLLGALAVSITRRLARLAKEPPEAFALFMEIAAAHGLSSEEEKMLKRLARSEKLSNPARVFVERRYVEHALESDPAGGWGALGEKLFGG
jgi:hypothetical protein